MNYGREFETRVVQESEAKGYTCVKIPEEVRGKWGRRRTVQVQTRYDFAAGIRGVACFFEAKACGEGTFNFKSKVLAKEKHHQFLALQSAERNRNHAGYLIWFYNQKNFVWLTCANIRRLMAEGHNSVSVKSPYITTQPDHEAIDLMKLIFDEKEKEK